MRGRSAAAFTLSSFSHRHPSLLCLGPSVDSGGGRPTKRLRELNPLGRPRDGLARAILCGCLGCSHVAVRGDDQCSSCLYHDDSSCPCTCGGCRLPEAEVSVQVPLREDTPSDTLCSLGDALCSLCSLPGCFSRTPVDEASGIRARCCGSSHEKVLLRLSLCPSVVPRGPLFPVEVSYFPGVGSRRV